mgnify:CR=1 FL=1
MNYLLLFISIAHAFVLGGFFYVLKSRGFFSPEVLYILFSSLHVFSLFFFSLDSAGLVGFLGYDLEKVQHSLLLSVILKVILDIVYILASLTVKSSLFFSWVSFPGRILSVDYNVRNVHALYSFAWTVSFFGAFFLYILIMKSGGLLYLWSNMGQRSVIFEGSGQYLVLAEVFLQSGVFLFMLVWVLGFNRISSILIIIVSVILLGLFGGRSPVLYAIFLIACVFYVRYKEFVFRLSHVGIVFGFLIFFSVVGALRDSNGLNQFRLDPVGFVASSVVDFPGRIAPYFSKIKRDIVIYEYFEDHNYWFGAQYESLLASPIPRSLFPDKPVIDGGRLVKAMHQGESVSPVSRIDEVPTTGWPEGNMAGYMNFGLIGLFLYTIASAFFVKSVYIQCFCNSRRNWLLSVYVYCVFLGPLAFDPYSLFRFAGYFSISILVLLSFKIWVGLRSLLLGSYLVRS